MDIRRIWTSRGRRGRVASFGNVTSRLALTCLALYHCAPAALAQQNEDEQDDARIVVTGTNLKRDGYKEPTPVTVIGTEILEQNAAPNVAYALTSQPAMMGSATTNAQVVVGAAATAGTNLLSLRNLGSNRTLVLVDGHRFPPAIPSGGVDISAIPQQLLKRVDVVTGGASAVYGSDAVAGVVNFVLDKAFSGLKGEVSGGTTTHGDGRNYRIDLSAGTSFAEGRGHVILSGQHSYDEGVGPYSRDFLYAGNQRVVNPVYSTGCGCPQFLIVDHASITQLAPGGIVYSGPLRGTIFGEGGKPGAFVYGPLVSDPYTQGGSWRSTDLRPTNPLSPEEERNSIFARASYDVTDDINVYGQASITRTKTSAVISSLLMQGSAGPLIQIDNAYLPQSVGDAMVANGLTSFRLGTSNADLGLAYQDTTRTSYVYEIGASGRFDALGSNWKWDVFGQRGMTRSFVIVPNSISTSKYRLAIDAVLDATGKIVCRSSLTDPTNGCAPWNPIGTGVNAIGSPGYEYIVSPSWQRLRMVRNIVGANITGEPFSTWAGPVSVGFNVQHRSDKVKATVDADSLIADHPFANVAPLAGSDEVTEGAFETVVPLTKGLSWAESLDINGAVRFTKYRYAGSVQTWKIGATYEPFRGLRFRATRSRDIRAPNLQELFARSSSSFATLFDPFTNATPLVNVVTSGNRTLKPEVAANTTFGVVVQPAFLPGASLSVDYWDINLKDVISTVSPADILQLCYDNAGSDACGNIVRDSSGNLTQVLRRQINLARNIVRGIDFEAAYHARLSDLSDSLAGELTLRAFFTRYLKDVTDNGLTDPVSNLGVGGGAKWRLNASATYALDPVTASITLRGFSGGKMAATWVECSTACPVSTAAYPTVNSNHMPGRLYVDANISLDVAQNVNAFFNVRNLFDKDPAFSVTGNAFFSGVSSVPYDVLGRMVRAGIRFKI